MIVFYDRCNPIPDFINIELGARAAAAAAARAGLLLFAMHARAAQRDAPAAAPAMRHAASRRNVTYTPLSNSGGRSY
eukprot:COSAG01_NODE_25742_length_734_cov_36.239370_1_plen_77_part_00